MKLLLVKDDFEQQNWLVLMKFLQLSVYLTDEETMEFAILENLQREDLTPIEEAEAYHNLNGKFKVNTRTTCL